MSKERGSHYLNLQDIAIFVALVLALTAAVCQCLGHPLALLLPIPPISAKLVKQITRKHYTRGERMLKHEHIARAATFSVCTDFNDQSASSVL